MQKENQFTLTANSKEYTLTTGEYMGTKTPKFMIRAELRGGEKAALFLLGIVDPITMSVRAAATSQEEAIKHVYKAALLAVETYITDNDWTHGGVYYGEMLEDGLFHITTEKPSWEDGNWGEKADF